MRSTRLAPAASKRRGTGGFYWLHCTQAALCAVVFALAGCANPGPPRPPSLHLPEPITDLTATRIGDRVELHWTAPTHTTDGLEVDGSTTVQVCRDAVAAPGSPAASHPPRPAPSPAPRQTPCTPAFQIAGHPGPSTVEDRLPARAGAPASLFAYRIRVLNDRGRSADPSSPALVPGGSGVIPLADFRAKQTRDGVLLEWQPLDTSAGDAVVEVTRTAQPATRARPSSSPGTPAQPTPPGQGPNGVRRKPQPASSGGSDREAPGAVVHLRAAAFPAQPPPGAPPTSDPGREPRDPGGIVDRSAAMDTTYLYTAQRVRTVSVAGARYEMRSEPAGPIAVALRDTFPPEPPRGLVSIPAVMSVPGQQPARPTIDLSWEPNTEPDLAGYLVYRSDPASGKQPQRLTPVPLPAPAYRDANVTPGRHYRYRITAVDQAGNESTPSAPVDDGAPLR